MESEIKPGVGAPGIEYTCTTKWTLTQWQEFNRYEHRLWWIDDQCHEARACLVNAVGSTDKPGTTWVWRAWSPTGNAGSGEDCATLELAQAAALEWLGSLSGARRLPAPVAPDGQLERVPQAASRTEAVPVDAPRSTTVLAFVLDGLGNMARAAATALRDAPEDADPLEVLLHREPDPEGDERLRATFRGWLRNTPTLRPLGDELEAAGAEAERASIVAFLREQQNVVQYGLTLGTLADAIERFVDSDAAEERKKRASVIAMAERNEVLNFIDSAARRSAIYWATKMTVALDGASGSTSKVLTAGFLSLLADLRTDIWNGVHSFAPPMCACGDVLHTRHPACPKCGKCPNCCGISSECTGNPKEEVPS